MEKSVKSRRYLERARDTRLLFASKRYQKATVLQTAGSGGRQRRLNLLIARRQENPIQVILVISRVLQSVMLPRAKLALGPWAFRSVPDRVLIVSVASNLSHFDFPVTQIDLACLIALHRLQISCLLCFARLLPCSVLLVVLWLYQSTSEIGTPCRLVRTVRLIVWLVHLLGLSRSVHCHKCRVKYRHR